MTRTILRRTVLACGVALVAAPALADASYPNKPVTIVVGYPAGGSTDLVGRLVANEIEKHLGQTVVVENLGGAGGAIGAQKVANAKPDGYTLLVGANNELAIANLVNKAVKYKISDFTPIGMVASQPMVLVASQKSGVKNTREFIDLVKAKPDATSYGSSGVGTALHLAGEMMKDQGKIKMQHVPYRGVPALTNDVLGNNIEFGVFVLSSGLPLIKSGKVVALGTTEAKRYPATPDIPALAEQPEFKNVNINSWFSLMGPANMPAPVVAKIKAALDKTMAAPEFRKKMEDAGAQVMDPKLDPSKYINTEIGKYKKIVDVAKIEL
ncbi:MULTISPECIES: Bug family tripartite tricarboxylate transporter substrate binding protein [Comamonas]|uniref:Tripartite tricarboxylate transporter substrate binding protein n=1 Tax=Comamonas terrigena TaxID=32013 RepID=A0A2A7UQT2_COMTR|nr:MULTISPECIES: tripartite tricarboxylate transporter substrate binding protein [Comamonas]MDH1502238.1 tripartite tricarboxylate transporter substrate binding protein [Comamonas terrigena]MDH1704175.1 tripartite tricarboxylate transporter substrate binding protein [Comamonas terrigena]MDI9856959.1 tripartite tricarboxylate transporter substrate binding protein [Comamonas sp. 17RB]PEH87623.1 tripartite tricarboxylate transporter substrate binding protein [Comamonas terrigena]SUY92572.1 Argini